MENCPRPRVEAADRRRKHADSLEEQLTLIRANRPETFREERARIWKQITNYKEEVNEFDELHAVNVDEVEFRIAKYEAELRAEKKVSTDVPHLCL